MADQNNTPNAGATAQARQVRAPIEGQVADISRIAAQQQALARLLEAGRRYKLSPEQIVSIAKMDAGEQAQPQEPAKGKGLIQKVEEAITTDTLQKTKKLGVGTAGVSVLYQVIDNIGDWSNGRTALDSALGVVTDFFTNWRSALDFLKDVFSTAIIPASIGTGIAILWGSKAWRGLKATWKKVNGAFALANEKAMAKVDAVAQSVKSFSKTAFIALSFYHLPSLIDTGRKLVEVEDNSSAWSQLNQIATSFFKAAPGAAIPVFMFITAAVVSGVILPVAKDMMKNRNENKKAGLLEEFGRLQAEAQQLETDPSAEPGAEPAPVAAQPEAAIAKPIGGDPTGAGPA